MILHSPYTTYICIFSIAAIKLHDFLNARFRTVYEIVFDTKYSSSLGSIRAHQQPLSLGGNRDFTVAIVAPLHSTEFLCFAYDSEKWTNDDLRQLRCICLRVTRGCLPWCCRFTSASAWLLSCIWVRPTTCAMPKRQCIATQSSEWPRLSFCVSSIQFFPTLDGPMLLYCLLCSSDSSSISRSIWRKMY